MDVADSSIPGCYLLVVVGEPYSDDHKRQILQKLSKGLLSWDVEAIGCDLSGLEKVCSNVKPGSEPENELLIQHSNETLAVEVLSNPQVSTLKQCLKNLLLATTGHKHLIYAGYSFKGTGSWILQNGTFSFGNFVEAFQDADVQKELNSHVGCTIHVHCTQEGEWTPANVEKHAIQKLAKITLNPPDKIDSLPGSSALIQCLESVLVTHTLEEMMTLSPLVGNIRFNRPTLYVFPGGQGDCALFGINGFNMLVDGGFNRKPCFWEFIRHLDRLDAVMVTRLCESNVCGITTMMKRKAINNIYPQIGYVFCNLAEGKSIPNDELIKEKDDLLVSVLTEGHSFLENLAELKMKPHRCLREITNVDPFTLYQKVGHGTLEMYTLSPQKDSKEVKEFLQQWASCKENFSRVKTGVNFQEQELSIPLSHAMSICSLVVWRPANPEDTITRIFFPGSAPQNRIFEGLEKLKNLDVLKQPVCSHSSLHPIEKPKPKLISKGQLTKNNVTSPLISNGIRRSSESLGSKKDAIESKHSIVEKSTTKPPIKKDVSKSPPELKKKEVKQPSTAIKKEMKEKKPVISPKLVEVKKATKLVETNKVVEPKTKGLKEVTNKKTIDSKLIKRKTEAPKPKPTPAPKAMPKTTKPSTQSPKHVPKTAEPRKITSIKSVKPSEKKKESKSNEEKHEVSKENLKKPDVKPQIDAPLDIKVKEQLFEEGNAPCADNNQLNELKDEIAIVESEIANVPSPVTESMEIEKKKNEVTVLAESTSLSIKEEKLTDDNICSTNLSLIENDGKLENLSTEYVPLIDDNEKHIDNSKLMENDSVIENKEKLDNDILAEKQQSVTDLFLATASMEGSMHEGLIDSIQDFNKETYIQKETDVLLECGHEKEREDRLAVEEEIIEEKSEKESLHDIMALENNEDEEENITLEREIPDSTILKEYEEKHITETEVVPMQHEERIQETIHKVCDNQYMTGNETVTVHCEEVSLDKIESEITEEKLSPVVSNKANLSVDIQSYSDDDDDIVKSPTPVAIVDYKDEESLETYKVLEQNEKYIEDGPENEKASKDEERELPNEEQFDVLMLETEKSDLEREKESSSFSEDEKDDDDEEMIRHPTPPGEQNFYEKIGTSDIPTNVEELDTRFMEHYLPATRQTPDSCHEPLYEEMEDEGESDSESPIMEQPVYSNVVQADYPEFVNISGGTTPSEPQSPKSVHDSKHRLPDVSEVLFKDTPPQESDEDRFEEEQKMTLTDVTSQVIAQEECGKDNYKEMKDEFKEQKYTDNLLEDKDKSMQSLTEITNENYNLPGTQVATGEIEYVLQKQEFVLHSQHDNLKSDGLIEDNDEILNRETDKTYHDLHSDDIVTDNLSLQQESEDEYNKYASTKENPTSKLHSEIEHSIIETEENILQPEIEDSIKVTTVSSDIFGSHGMDQSFHESYIGIGETNEPVASRMEQSFHESYIETEETNEPVSSMMDQSFHESYIETEETKEPITSRMDQSFHESYIETEETNELVSSTMDQSFHENYIETEKTNEPVSSMMDQSFHERYIETEETNEPISSKMDQSFHENYIETEEIKESVVSRMDQSIHECYTETGEANEPTMSRMDQSFHESYIETGETNEPTASRMDQSFHESYTETEETNEPTVSRMDQSIHESYIETDETNEPMVSKMDKSSHESYIETEKTNEPIISRVDQSFQERYIEKEETNEPAIPNIESYLEKESMEPEDPYSSYTMQQEAQSIHDYTDMRETDMPHFDDSKEKSNNEYDKEEQDRAYEDEIDERIREYTIDSYHREKDGGYVTEDYHREEKDEKYIAEEYYRKERDEDDNYTITTEKHHREDKSYTNEPIEGGYFEDNEKSQFADYDCTTQRTTYSYQSRVSTSDGDAISAERKELLYSATTNGVNLPRDINGHETDMWKDKGLSNYGTKDGASFRNHNDDYDKSPGDYDDGQDLYRGINVSDPAYASSDFKTNDITQHQYMDTASVDDILLERKETTIEKTSFSSMSCTYSNKDYHQEHEDNILSGQYSEHVSGLHDIQKESSTGFRLEDWSKPLGLPSPPESKTAVKSSTKPSPATKTNKLDKKPKVAENGKPPVIRASPKTEKTNKPKTNGAAVPPVYVDLSYVPHHGDPNYCNVEFFRRIRARYYVFSGINPSKEVLNALLEAKKSWKDDSEVTIIPTYETDTLGYWMALNQDSLIENKIDVAPSASRCTVNLQDHETSCAAYRLEF